jgi:hypothetical protein
MSEPIRPIGPRETGIDPVLAARRTGRRDPRDRDEAYDDAERREKRRQAAYPEIGPVADGDGHIDVVA